MYTGFSKKFNKKINIIYPGEYYISDKDELISTILGSCVSVCLIDYENKIAAMNHFMLPGKSIDKDIRMAGVGEKYGITAIHKLFFEFEKRGADISTLKAKVFGGATVLHNTFKGNLISLDNIRLAKVILEHEDIHITKIDVGGESTRKIVLDIFTGDVYLKKVKSKEIMNKVVENEKKYIDKINKKLEF